MRWRCWRCAVRAFDKGPDKPGAFFIAPALSRFDTMPSNPNLHAVLEYGDGEKSAGSMLIARTHGPIEFWRVPGTLRDRQRLGVSARWISRSSAPSQPGRRAGPSPSPSNRGWGLRADFSKSGKTLKDPGQLPAIIRDWAHICARGTP
jgi:hypothetical protein